MAQRSRQELGRSSRHRGKANQMKLAAWLRQFYPSAAYEIRNHRGDVTGTGSLSVEATLAGWQEIAAKMDQSQDDAAERGLTRYCLVKHRYGESDEGESWVITRAKVFFPMAARLDELEILEAAVKRYWPEWYRTYGQVAEAKREMFRA